jgi:hypothetical protein
MTGRNGAQARRPRVMRVLMSPGIEEEIMTIATEKQINFIMKLIG